MKLEDGRSQARLQRLNWAILGGFLAIGAALVFWSTIRPDVLAREDNPRLVEAELRIQRGRILDRDEMILAETTGPAARQERVYPRPQIGPAVGYYSFRHGTAGVEESFDAILRGDTDDFRVEFRRRALHRPQVGRDIRLTLDAGLQKTAVSLFNDQVGSILLLDAGQPEIVDILALVSQPGYDPNRLDELFDNLTADESAPLLNRATQGQYQPGLVLQPFILAAALEQGLINLGDPVADANRPVFVNGAGIRCRGRPPASPTWADILRYHCPAPMQALADQLGRVGLAPIFEDFGLTVAPQFDLETAVPTEEPLSDLHLAAIGQDNLTVTPLQIGLAWAALAGDGRLPQPRLVTAAQDENGDWGAAEPPAAPPPRRPVTAATARALHQALPGQGSIREYSRLVLSGPEGSTNGWYLGLADHFVVVIVVEGSDDLLRVEAIGRGVITAALAAGEIQNDS